MITNDYSKHFVPSPSGWAFSSSSPLGVGPARVDTAEPRSHGHWLVPRRAGTSTPTRVRSSQSHDFKIVRIITSGLAPSCQTNRPGVATGTQRANYEPLRCTPKHTHTYTTVTHNHTHIHTIAGTSARIPRSPNMRRLMRSTRLGAGLVWRGCFWEYGCDGGRDGSNVICCKAGQANSTYDATRVVGWPEESTKVTAVLLPGLSEPGVTVS
jgi:hypothetical protein